MRKGFRVLITDRCNMNCPTCFNRGVRSNREMSVEDFSQLCVYLKEEGHIERLKIMGGEPTVHNDFLEIVNIAQKVFPSIHIFTNGVNDEIAKVKMRENDTIIYNLSCMGEQYPSAKLLPEQNFVHAYETRIDSKCSIDRIMRVISHVHSIVGDEIVINLTLDCTEDIFTNKEVLINNWNAVVSFIEGLHVRYRVDHAIPYCFFVGSAMRIKVHGSFCPVACAGLITPDLKLRHCNQTDTNLLSVRQDGRFVPWQILEQYITCDHFGMQHKSLEKICKDCLFYGRKCDGGCFIFKPRITRQSIIGATDLPLK